MNSINRRLGLTSFAILAAMALVPVNLGWCAKGWTYTIIDEFQMENASGMNGLNHANLNSPGAVAYWKSQSADFEFGCPRRNNRIYVRDGVSTRVVYERLNGDLSNCTIAQRLGISKSGREFFAREIRDSGVIVSVRRLTQMRYQVCPVFVGASLRPRRSVA